MTGILNFPDILYFREVQTGEKAYCGLFDFAVNMQLTQARLFLYKGGVHGSTEFRLSAFSDVGLTRRLFSSDWYAIADIPDVSNNWLGYVSVTFNKPWINEKNPLYFAIETQNYTLTPSFSIMFSLDWPFPVNDQDDPATPGVRIEFQGLEEYDR